MQVSDRIAAALWRVGSATMHGVESLTGSKVGQAVVGGASRVAGTAPYQGAASKLAGVHRASSRNISSLLSPNPIGVRAWNQFGSSVKSGAIKGALVGAGLNTAYSMIDNASNGRGVMSGTPGAALKGAVFGGAGGALYAGSRSLTTPGLGQNALRSNIRTARSRSRAARRR